MKKIREKILLIFSMLLFYSVGVAQTMAQAHLKYEITGVNDTIKTNIQKRLHEFDKTVPKQQNEMQLLQAIERSNEQVVAALQPFGYFHPQVQSELITKEKNSIAHYDVKLGPQIKITQIKIKLKGQGSEDPLLHNFIQHFPLHKNSPFETESYEVAKQKLFNLAQSNAYLNAKYTQKRLKIFPENNTATIQLTLDTGPRYYFGDVHFSDSSYSHDFLMRYVPFAHGDTLNNDKLFALQNALQRSGYFQLVTVLPDPKPHDRFVPIKVTLVPVNSQSFLYGLGLGDTGLRGLFAWDWHNVTPTGHKFRTLAQISEQASTGQAIYTIPGLDPLNDQYIFTVATTHLNNNKGESDAALLSAAYQTKWQDWQTTYGLNALYEDTRELLFDPGDKAYMLYPNLTFHKTVTDDNINTLNGYRIQVYAQGTPRALSSKSGFVQLKVDGKVIKTIHDSTRLILQGTLGLMGADNLDEIPLSLQFFTGGAQSIRGYSRQAFGPGNYLYVGSMEIQQALNEDWSIAAFADTGNVIRSGDPFSFHSSVGLGIVRKTMIGPLEIGFARTLDGHDHSIRLIVSVGPDL